MPKFAGLGRTEVDAPGELEPVEGYLADVLADVEPLGTEELALDDCLGRVLAEAVAAVTPIPGFANSAMDGYAVRAGDTPDGSAEAPTELTVVGGIAAGASDPVEVGPGAAVRIMTGAPIPAGADAVVPVELTSSAGMTVRVHLAAERGQHIRHPGEDVAAGEQVLPAGLLLRPAAIAMAAAVGRRSLLCRRRARVIMISTGDELVRAGEPLAQGGLYDSNGPMVLALARSEGALAHRVGPVPDDPALLRTAIADAAADADIVLLSGGVSAGAHDHLPDVLAELGTCRRAKLAMKPGKPQLLARVGDCRVLGLPGNPVSTFVSFELFAIPLLRTLQGRIDVRRPTVTASAACELRGSAGKRTFLRVRLETRPDALVAHPAGGQGSHIISALTSADGLAEVPGGVTHVPAGAPVRVRLFTDLAGGGR